MIITKVVLFILSLGISGFLSSSETAIFSLKATQLFKIKQKNPKIFEIITILLASSENFIAMLLVLNEFVNIFASVLFADIFHSIFGNKFLALSSGVMVFLLLLFGDITPKSLAVKNNVFIAIIFAKPLYYLFKATKPIVSVFTSIIQVFKKVFFKNMKQENVLTITENEFKSIVASADNIFNESEKRMIENVFQFEEKQIKDIMIPLRKVAMVEANTKIGTFLKGVDKIKYKRIPVYQQKRTQIIGMLYIKDLIKKMWEESIDKKSPIVEIARDPVFINHSWEIDKAFKFIIRQKVHLLIVEDDHGTPVGVVGLENIMEEIVGEIEDDTN